ncbi:hypothetical protein CERSUDRAFT_127671 [Gelatoporia subvermispora B]|uniref:APC amino acid permease n=1 Tax=Ceriporiopsis subvermispora (strain B) TaxID=914234 RepID=M2P6R2_CERS8|nr:hypothetical protein CERSUDRAFT_127671 [Gelatoporia subvermispora B]
MDADTTLHRVTTRFIEADTHSASESILDGSTTADRDAAALAKLGYKQEFKRAFTPLEVFGLGFSIIGLFPSIASVLVFAIPNGGPVALIWGWTICLFFLLFIGLALAELGSAAPTSGGLYYWTYTFASPRWRRVLSWVVGYSNTIGNIAGLASIDWGCAVQVMAAVNIGSNMTFVPTTQQTYGVYVALLICHASVASLGTPIIARLQGIYIWFNVLLCLAVIIALPVSTPKEFRNSASYAFGGFANFYGWPDGFAFILSFLAPLWTIGGFDAGVHTSEEASNARTAVPWAIVSSVVIAGILGWDINVVIMFYMGTDLDNIMASPIGQPMATILFNSLGQKGTLAMWSIVVIIQFFMGSSIVRALHMPLSLHVTSSILADRLLPPNFRLLARRRPAFLIHTIPHESSHGAPVNCVWASAFVAALLGLLPFAGGAASSAIFSLAIMGQYVAYSIPISSRFLGGKAWVPGPFSLGRLGLPVAIIAVCWMAFSAVTLAFPTTPAPTGPTMNYMIVVMGGWIALCLVYFYFPKYGGVHWFDGPRANLGNAYISGADTASAGDEKASL